VFPPSQINNETQNRKEKKQGGGGMGHKGDWKASTDGM